MKACISAAQVRAWAAFAHDYNPIHFDVAAARRLGASRPVVHGMLPTILGLDLAHRRAAPPAQPGLSHGTCSVRLKRPVEVDSTVSFALSERPERRQRFRCEQAGTVHLVGELSLEQTPDDPEPTHASSGDRSPIEIPSFVLEGSSLRAALSRFHHVFPTVSTPWIVLSSLLFAEFVRRATELLRPAALSILDIATEDELVFVQTSYAVRFSLDDRPLSGSECFVCAVSPVPLATIDAACVGTCVVEARAGDRRIIRVSIGMLVKKSTPTLSRKGT